MKSHDVGFQHSERHTQNDGIGSEDGGAAGLCGASVDLHPFTETILSPQDF